MPLMLGNAAKRQVQMLLRVYWVSPWFVRFDRSFSLPRGAVQEAGGRSADCGVDLSVSAVSASCINMPPLIRCELGIVFFLGGLALNWRRLSIPDGKGCWIGESPDHCRSADYCWHSMLAKQNYLTA